MNITIGLSYAPESRPKYHFYAEALEEAAKRQEINLGIVLLSSFPELINTVDGIVFTGGADVDPAIYGKKSEREFCEEINPLRDDLEFALAKKADERSLPILGICRGLQLLNVHYGGTLIVDLPRAGKQSHSQVEGKDIRHEVRIEAGTLLKKVTRQIEAPVTSAHHQAIDQLAPEMKISAYSSIDGVVEAFEWADQEKKPFLLAVQWHPERMEFDEGLSGSLFESFLLEVTARKILGERIK